MVYATVHFHSKPGVRVARLEGDTGAFVVVSVSTSEAHFGNLDLFVHNAEQADAIIEGLEEAKRLLSNERERVAV